MLTIVIYDGIHKVYIVRRFAYRDLNDVHRLKKRQNDDIGGTETLQIRFAFQVTLSIYGSFI